MRVPKIILFLVLCAFVFDIIEAKIHKRHHGLRSLIKKRAERHHRHHRDEPGQETTDTTTPEPNESTGDQPTGDTTATGPTCRYQERDGQCQASCPHGHGATDAAKIQTACPAGLTCCFEEDTSNWCSRGHQAGSCITTAECDRLNTAAEPHHSTSNLCRGAANANKKCCLSGPFKTAGFDTDTLDDLVDIPTNVNDGISSAPVAFQKLALGNPGVRCSSDACVGCCETESAITRQNLVDMDVGPFNLRVFRPFGEKIKEVFEEVLTARPELFWYVSTAGSFCCRPVKQDGHALVGTYSNHAWGAAVDLYYGPRNDVQGDDKTQQGLLDLVPYFNRRKIYWGGGFRKEDSMHFEASEQAVVEWGCSDNYRATGFHAVSERVGGVRCPAAGETADSTSAVENAAGQDNAPTDTAPMEYSEAGAGGQSEEPNHSQEPPNRSEATANSLPEGIEPNWDDSDPGPSKPPPSPNPNANDPVGKDGIATTWA